MMDLPAIGTYVRVRTKEGEEFAGTVEKSGEAWNMFTGGKTVTCARLDTRRYFIPALGDVLLYSGPQPILGPRHPIPSAGLGTTAPTAPVIKRGGNYVEREMRKAWFWTGLAILFSLATIFGLLR